MTTRTIALAAVIGVLVAAGSLVAAPVAKADIDFELQARMLGRNRLKTFWTGIGGWTDRQLADGTVIWDRPHHRGLDRHNSHPNCCVRRHETICHIKTAAAC